MVGIRCQPASESCQTVIDQVLWDSIAEANLLLPLALKLEYQ